MSAANMIDNGFGSSCVSPPRVRPTRLIVGTVFVLAASAIVGFNMRYFEVWLRGPRPVSPRELATLARAPGESSLVDWVTLTELVPTWDTGLADVMTRNGKELYRNAWFVATIDDRVILVQAPSRGLPDQLYGPVNRMSESEQEFWIGHLESTSPEDAERLLPVTLRTAVEFSAVGYTLLTVAGGLFLVGGWAVITGVTRLMASRPASDQTAHSI